MPSEAAKKRQAQKREKRQASSRSAQKRPTGQQSVEVRGDIPQSQTNGELDGGASATAGGASASATSISDGIEKMKLSPRTCTGECVLCMGMM